MTVKTEVSSPLKFSPEVRQDNIQILRSRIFDILVIGGGITGVGIARDAALRGFKTALIEKADFAAGTSSKSSKLIHGGFRYLRQFQFGLVHEALMERQILMNLAPHLVHPKRCLLPIYEGAPQPPLVIHLGMWLYDLLAFTRNIGRHRMIPVEELKALEPDLRSEGLRKGAVYYDCRADDFRLVMANIQSAAQQGSIVASYVKAEEVLLEKGKVVGILARDLLTGEEIAIRSRTVANATGPWSDQVRAAMVKQTQKRLRTTKGVHLVIRRQDLPIHLAFMQFAVQDGRPIFAIPWRSFVLLGTTDTDYAGDPDWIYTECSDVDYLLESFNYYFPRANLTHDKIVSTFAGLRPLSNEADKKASEVSREHEIFESPVNFFTIIGGKLTTYRIMARELVDLLSRRLSTVFRITPGQPKCRTDRIPLYGGEIPDYTRFQKEWKTRLTRDEHFADDIAEHFIETFGANIPLLLSAIAATPDGRERIHPHLPHVWGELTYALRHEMTLALDDFLIRRTHIFSLDPQQGLAIHQEVADRLAERLGWSKEEKQAQIDRYKFKISLTQHYRKETSHEDPVHR